MKWWEKTVEYFFILNCRANHMRIAPLDGKEERAGDVLFSSDNNWVLIEFKRDMECLKSEEKKLGADLLMPRNSAINSMSKG